MVATPPPRCQSMPPGRLFDADPRPATETSSLHRPASRFHPDPHGFRDRGRSADQDAAAPDQELAGGVEADRLGQGLTFGLEDPGGQGLGGVVVEDRDRDWKMIGPVS